MKFDTIEGSTPIDFDEVSALIPSLSTQSELNEYEARNIRKAMDWAASSRQIRSSLLTAETLKQLHQRMFNATWRWAGQYRKTEKSIGVTPYRISSELKILLDDVHCWLEFKTYDPDEIAVRFHHRLVWIHPFVNGNGRHARLSADLLCYQQRISPFSWGSKDLLSQGGARKRYLSALSLADQHDYSALFEFVRS